MHQATGSTIRRGLVALTAAACMCGGAASPAAAQSRGVIIQIPDDVAPGAPRPAPAPPAPAAPVVAPSPGAGPTAGAAPPVCSAALCDKDRWHVLNTANRTCLLLSKDDLRGRDVRKLSTLLPAPLFVIASGGCP